MKQKRFKKLNRVLKIAAVIVCATAIFRLTLFLIPYKGLNEFIARQYSTRFYDRNGNLLQVLALEEGLHREFTPLEEIPEALVKEFISQEDSLFYFHPGVDVFAIIRALFQNKTNDKIVSGASTITMQLVRMIEPRSEKVTLTKKIKEAFKALHLEAKLSKKQILELYLNNVPFGFQTEGVTSAARLFYSKTPDALSLEEIKTLALIPRRPSYYAPPAGYNYPFECPHFINYIVSDYSHKKQKIPRELYLSVDVNLVHEIEKLIMQQITLYEDSRIHNGSAFVINNRTGEIFAWVGNADFFDEEHGGQIDGVLVKNQPGSSMKPFLYALALEKGFTPDSVLPDIQQDFGTSQVYVPLNFNNHFNGPVRFRVALGSSLNIPAVYLLYHCGVDSYFAKLLELGFDSLKDERNNQGLSLALGAGEIQLKEIVRAFSVFTNDGFLLKDLTFLKSPDRSAEKIQVYKKDTARIICDILSDKNARELGFGFAKVFDTPYPSIFKTGTSNQFQNITALGSTSEFTAGVWMGNFEGQTVVGKTGSSIPALVVRSILDALTKEYGAENFKACETYEKKTVCALSAMSATECCPATVQEYVLKGTASSKEPCNFHSKKDGLLVLSYPSEYQHWALSQNSKAHISDSVSELEIVYPKNNSVYIYDESFPASKQKLQIRASGGKERRATLYVDGLFVSTVEIPFAWSIGLQKGKHSISVECGNEKDSIEVTVK